MFKLKNSAGKTHFGCKRIRGLQKKAVANYHADVYHNKTNPLLWSRIESL